MFFFKLGRSAFSHSLPAVRDGLAKKKDIVTELHGGLLKLDTSTSSGPVAEASLTVRADDYHPVVEDLRLRDDTQIEIAELSYDVVGLSSLRQDIFGSQVAPEPMRFPSPAPIHAMLPNASQMAASELPVRTVLHNLGADLGEQVTVHQVSNDAIQVDGVAEDETRKQQISNALNGIRHTQVRIMTVAQAAVHPQPGHPLPTATDTLITASAPLLEEQLEKRFPDSDQRAEYVINLSRYAKAHPRAWALARLADRYSSQQTALLDPEAQHQLQSLLTDHITALRQDVGRLQNQLSQVLSSASNTAAANTATSASVTSQQDDWRIRAYRVHSSVEIIIEVVSVLLTGSTENSTPPDKLELRLRTTLTQLQAELQLLDQRIHK